MSIQYHHFVDNLSAFKYMTSGCCLASGNMDGCNIDIDYLYRHLHVI